MVNAFILALRVAALLAHYEVSGWTLFVLAILAAMPAMDAAVALVNRAAAASIGPAPLPGLALRDGVPAELRTMVVVPTLLTTPAELEEQVERLEVHYLASQDGDLRFALLSDWTDSATETAPGDDELLGAAAAAIARLNQRHGPRAGWGEISPAPSPANLERGRRKVDGMGAQARQASRVESPAPRRDRHDLRCTRRRTAAVPAGVRYVITLDADTRLPRGAAKRLVGKMAHALNGPRFDPSCGRVVEGYGVLQPRVTPSLPTGREGSVFQRVFSSASGIDPYAFAVSDVYQDLFGEGSYSGKGIYDVDIFEAALQRPRSRQHNA